MVNFDIQDTLTRYSTAGDATDSDVHSFLHKDIYISFWSKTDKTLVTTD
jgi:hypothetical protein